MILIGRRDKIDIPCLGIFDLEAKVDTGAYGCALHCYHIEVNLKGQNPVLEVQFLDPKHPGFVNETHRFETFEDKIVKSSSGTAEHRYTIKTAVQIFDMSIITEFSLTDRSEMKYPVLLGRKFLSGRFIVDVTKKNLSFHKKQKDI